MGEDSATAQDEIRRLKILFWLTDPANRAQSVLACYLNKRGGWIASDIQAMVRQDLHYLMAQGWIEEDERGWQKSVSKSIDVSGARVIITEAGRSKTEEMRAELASKPARVASCRSSVLWWLYYQNAIGPSQSLSENNFFLDKHSVYCGQQFSQGELLAAYGWLNRKGLVDGTDPDEARTPILIYLTDSGVSCIERYDGATDSYLDAVAQQQPSSRSQSGPVINIHGGQVVMATGDYSQQTMNIGSAAEQLVLVIDGIAEMLRSLRLDSDYEATLERVRRDAVDDVTSQRPSGQAVKRFYDWVLGCVKQGGSVALTAAVTAAANGMLHDVEQLSRALGI
jgi:hypothetical protein